jgi:hypothetical protein
MPLVAEIIDQKAYDSGAGKTALAIQVIVYDDADPDKRPVTVPLDLTVDLEGFTSREKTEAAMRAAIAAEVTARLGERKTALERSASVARSLVGTVIALEDGAVVAAPVAAVEASRG